MDWIRQHITYTDPPVAPADRAYQVVSLDELEHRHKRQIYAITTERDTVQGNHKAEGEKTIIVIRGAVKRFAMVNPENGRVECEDDLGIGAVLHIPRETPFALHIAGGSALVIATAFWIKHCAYEDAQIMDEQGEILHQLALPQTASV